MINISCNVELKGVEVSMAIYDTFWDCHGFRGKALLASGFVFRRSRDPRLSSSVCLSQVLRSREMANDRSCCGTHSVRVA